MTDLALSYEAGTGAIDMMLAGGQLATDDGMRTAILISLFSDARARDDDPLLEPGADRRGWWGDCEGRADGDETGSLLWLLARSKIVPATLVRAREISDAALAWFVEDKIVSAIEVEVETFRPQTLAFGVTVVRGPGPSRQRYDYVWDFS